MAAVLPGVGTVQVVDDQRVHLPLLLDAALVAGVDHRRALLPLHGDIRLGHLAGQVGSATLLQLQVVQRLHKGDRGSCGERGSALLQHPHPAPPPGQSWVSVVTLRTRSKRNKQHGMGHLSKIILYILKECFFRGFRLFFVHRI